VSEINAYLHALRVSLAGSDPALIQDALSETETRFRRQREHLAWAEPLLSGPEAVARILGELGDPGTLAETYRQRERIVADALGPVAPALPAPGEAPEPPAPPRPWPSFFGVFVDAKAYTSLVYLLAGFFTGIFYFTWTVTGLSLSAGLLLMIIGIPVLVLFLGSVRALGLGEGRLVEALLDVRMPRRPPLLPEGTGWLNRLTNLFTDSYTWKCIVYLLFHFPLALTSFLIVFTAIVISLSLVAAPLTTLVWHLPVAVGWDQEYFLPVWLACILPVGGILGLAGTLHLGLALGRLHGGLARVMLVRR